MEGRNEKTYDQLERRATFLQVSMYIKCIRNFSSRRIDFLSSLRSRSPFTLHVPFPLFVFIDTSPRDSLDPHETQLRHSTPGQMCFSTIYYPSPSLFPLIHYLYYIPCSSSPSPLSLLLSLSPIRFNLFGIFLSLSWKTFLGHSDRGKQSDESVFSSCVTNEEVEEEGSFKRNEDTKGMRCVRKGMKKTSVMVGKGREEAKKQESREGQRS